MTYAILVTPDGTNAGTEGAVLSGEKTRLLGESL